MNIKGDRISSLWRGSLSLGVLSFITGWRIVDYPGESKAIREPRKQPPSRDRNLSSPGSSFYLHEARKKKFFGREGTV